MKLSNLIGQTLDDKYYIEKQLGKGGMGSVYLATHIGTGRPVAVKVIVPQFMANDEFVERFKREAKAAGRLRHPNVVDVTDFGFATVSRERVAYLVMEYLDGCSLGDILSEEKRLPLEWVVDILEQVCSAVDEAHKQGIIHRDLKPDNIWLEPNRRGGYTVKVLDFGLAKLGESVIPEASEPPDGDSYADSGSINSLPSADLLPDTRAMARNRQTHVQEISTQVKPAGDEVHTRVVPQEEATAVASVKEEPPALPESDDSAHEEAITQIQAPGAANAAAAKLQLTPEIEESQTLITMSHGESFPPDNPAASEEGQTQIQSPHTTQREGRRLFSQQSFERHDYSMSDSDDGLTRAGSILGTPLYMSPEQCNGDMLDARSDVYSLGILTYQMLTGATPFAGDMETVLKHHADSEPPAFKERTVKMRKRRKRYKIPKTAERVVMQALNKNPQDRPQSALAYAQMLRASNEGSGTLLRRSFTLYSEYFPKFFTASLLVSMPGILLEILHTVNTVLALKSFIPKTQGYMTDAAFGLCQLALNFISTSILSAATVRMATQLIVAPLRPLSLRHAFAAVKQRLRPVLWTTTIVALWLILGIILFLIPGLLVIVFYCLTLPVVMMEGLSGRAAMKRSKVLARRGLRTVIASNLIQYGLPILASITIGILIFPYVKIGEVDPRLVNRITDLMKVPFTILITPLISIMIALLYLKMRDVGGENLQGMFSQFEEEDAPQTKWQKKMRERLSLNTTTKI
jgi:serine/threonine protein kinase